jgi:hypothetical protein
MLHVHTLEAELNNDYGLCYASGGLNFLLEYPTVDRPIPNLFLGTTEPTLVDMGKAVRGGREGTKGVYVGVGLG